MALRLFSFHLLLLLGVLRSSAQVWQAPNVDLGSLVPKPQAPRPSVEGFIQEHQAQLQAQTDALRAQADQLRYQQQQGQQDIQETQRYYQQQALLRTQAYADNKQLHEGAYLQLKGMLEGTVRYDFKRAVFMTENVFMGGQYDYGKFKSRIDELVLLCRGLAADSVRPNYTARFMALHRLMTDTIQVTYGGKLVSAHLPYAYDFEDYQGKEDWTKLFVNKLLETNTGQCHSLPLLYKMVADELGVKTYITMAPSHSYIQVKDPRGQMYGYETTNGYFTTFSYYMNSGYVKAAALKSRMFLDTLTRRELLATRVLDLAMGYEFRHGYDGFVEKCTALALRYYPQSAQGRMQAYNNALHRFFPVWAASGKPPKAQAAQYPALQPLLADIEKCQRTLVELGYEDMPPEKYTAWLQQLDTEKNKVLAQKSAQQFQQKPVK